MYVHNHRLILTSASGDSTVYRYYERDYLGSTRAVLAEDGTLLQDANYYPGGLSFSQLNDTEETDRLHCGKEWVDMEGLGWYDNTARFHDAVLCRFTTPDPLAEQRVDVSPYVFCSNNPINRIDPDGLFDFENIASKQNYNIVSVFPTKRDDVVELAYQSAVKNNIPIMIVDNINDFANAMTELSNIGTTTSGYAVTSHGNSGFFYIGSTEATTMIDFTMLEKGLSGKNIFINACNTAYGPDGSQLLLSMSADTNSSVIGSTHKISAGYNFDGSDGLTYNAKANAIIGLFGANYSNQYKISTNGDYPTEIYNVKIDTINGISWDNGNKSLVSRILKPVIDIISNIFNYE